MKVCLHSKYATQISLQFDEIFKFSDFAKNVRFSQNLKLVGTPCKHFPHFSHFTSFLKAIKAKTELDVIFKTFEKKFAQKHR